MKIVSVVLMSVCMLVAGSSPAVSLSEQEVADLLHIAEEEKVAHDV